LGACARGKVKEKNIEKTQEAERQSPTGIPKQGTSLEMKLTKKKGSERRGVKGTNKNKETLPHMAEAKIEKETASMHGGDTN